MSDSGRYAYDGLDAQKKVLLSRIAVFSDDADYETLSTLNPYLPPKPEEVSKPEKSFSFELYHLRQTLESTDTDKAHSEIKAKIEAEEARLEAEYKERSAAYEAYQQALAEYLNSSDYQEAITAFENALTELEDRGLLQWDRDDNTYNLHPVVRGYAFDQLEETDRTQIYDRVRDHFRSLPPEDVEDATELADLKQTIEIYRALVGAGRLDEAASFYRGTFSATLLFSLAAYHTIIELLTPLFSSGLDNLPTLSDGDYQGFIINNFGIALKRLGRHDEALLKRRETIILDLDNLRSNLRTDFLNWEVSGSNLSTSLKNYATSLFSLNRLAASLSTTQLAHELKLLSTSEIHARSHLDLMTLYTYTGQFEAAESSYADFSALPEPPRSLYRQGEGELDHSRLLFYQNRPVSQELDDALSLAVQEKNIEVERQIHALRADVALQQGHLDEAVEAIQTAITMARKSGVPVGGHLGCLARALVQQEHYEEARRVLEEALEEPNLEINAYLQCSAAEVYLALGEQTPAEEYALAAYKTAWADGPPYSRWWELQWAKKLLARLNVSEPNLPSFDPSKVEPIPYEKEIRAFIEKLKAKKKEREDNSG